MSMKTWGLVLETTVGLGERKHTEAHVMAHVEGTREAALAELERLARAHIPEHPRSPKRRRLFRDGDGFLLVVDGAWQSHATRFYVGELMDDTDGTVPTQPVAAGAVTAEVLPEAVVRDEDGIPVKPAWLGRTDLP